MRSGSGSESRYNPRVISTTDNDTKEPWYGDGLSFSCTQCGNCCTGPSGYVWFDEDEAREMADYLKIDIAEFYSKYTAKALGRRTLGEVRRDKKTYDCVFLVETGAGKRVCGVYPVRPVQCRTWPFWPSNLKSRRAWDAAAESCPGMRHPEARGPGFVPIEEVRVRLAENPDHL